MDTVNETTNVKIPWYNRLQFRVLAIFLIMFMLIVVAIISIANTLGESMIERQAYSKLADAGHRVISELQRRTLQAESLVDSMAKVAVGLPTDNNHYPALIKQLIDHQGSRHLIAGGGVWPEPFKFSPKKERDSYFWGRNQHGELHFYDDYNQADTAGYHHEEWYVPTKQLQSGGIYWSKSYTDPYSLQPMVTVSTPMYQQEHNVGVATIDLKLEGLRELLHKATSRFGGYAFAIDRNGRFLAFPDDSLARNKQPIVTDGSLIPFRTIYELAEELSSFRPFSTLLDRQIDSIALSASEHDEQFSSMANKLATDSYQIQLPEAKIIAAVLIDSAKPTSHLNFTEQHTVLAQDYFLKEAVFVSVTTMPKTYWQIVTVMPQSVARLETVALFNLLITVTIIAVLAAMTVAWLYLRYHLTQPLRHLSHQLKNSIQDKNQSIPLIKTRDKGELGALAHWFNLRSKQLNESQIQIKNLAFYDGLTSLPNRRLLLDRLEQKLKTSKRRKYKGAALFIDVDNFKNLNDSLGHSVGDELLVQVGNRLSECLRDEDTIARIGGDEFVIVIISESHNLYEIEQQAARVASRIIESLSLPFELSGFQYHITVSMGISLFPKEHQGVDEILKEADTAMYQAKSNGRNTFRFFEEQMQTKADELLRIQRDLRYAIDTNELSLHYQPQVDVSGICHSVEALVRWHHPEDGQISPAIFIPIAEKSGLILSLGRWVLFEACHQISRWNEQGLILHHVAVNVSPRQFKQDDFIYEVTSALEQFHIRPQQLMLEITEGVILDDTEAAVNKMNALREIGVSISMDDFGTGYSSLTYLKQLPLDQLKIDQSFIHGITSQPDDAVIVEAIISMARQLGYEVIAEGVETEEQRHLLLEKGCFLYQGFYFSRPLPVDGLVSYLEGALDTSLSGR